MNTKITLVGAALAATLLVPAIASASFILDTGTPTSSAGPATLSTAQWLAGEFTATTGEDITSLSAYLTQGSGQPGDSFTFDIYSSNGFLGRSSGWQLPAAAWLLGSGLLGLGALRRRRAAA